MGTRTEATIMRVIDGDTILVKIPVNDKTITAVCRAASCDTEESKAEVRSKPVTNAGILACEFGRQYWWNNQPILEFDSDEPLEVCIEQERDYFGRLTCTLWNQGENYNLRLIKEGLSPYFNKYGNSRRYHRQYVEAQEEAQFARAGIWNPSINAGIVANAPNYIELIPYWNRRAAIVDQYRVYAAKSIYDATKTCDNLCHQIRQTPAEARACCLKICLLSDLQGGVVRSFEGGAVFRTGTKKSSINLWVRSTLAADEIVKKFAGNYAYVKGVASVRRGVVQVEVLEVCDRFPFENQIVVPESDRTVRKQKALQDVRYAAHRVIERRNASH